MTNKEALIKSTDRFMIEEFRDIETHEIIQEAREHLPLTLPYFIKAMGCILVGIIDNMFSVDFPDVTIAGGSTVKGKRKKTPQAIDYINCLCGNDFIRGTVITTQLHGFINWWLDQEAETGDIGNQWCDYETIAKKWNQYAEIRRHGKSA